MNEVTPTNLDELRRYCTGLSAGPISDESEMERLLAACWNDLVGDDGGMTDAKLPGRMEGVVWQPPKIVFRIERHGATVIGSTRAEVQEWTIDLERRTKAVVTVGRRQVRPMQGRLDVQPIADEIAAAILESRPDDRLKWDGTDHVRLLIGKVLPAGSAVKETLAGRRKRLRESVAVLVVSAGWKLVKANVFEKVEEERMLGEADVYLTPDEIHYLDNGIVSLGNDHCRVMLAKAMTRIPAEIVEAAFEKCLFYMPGVGEEGCFLPNGLIGNKHIIAFSKELLDQPDEEQIRTVLHETAQFALGHKSPFEDSDLDYDQQERAAWSKNCSMT